MKYPKSILSLAFTLFVLSPSSSWAYSKPLPGNPSPEQVRSTMALKKYMQSFGSLVAGMEIMKYKESAKPDWDAIRLTFKEMQDSLNGMKEADTTGNYREFTDILQKNLSEVQAYGKAKDKRVFDSFEKLTNTCFQCHAAHRPSDFLIPKKGDPRLSEEPKASSFLWPRE